MKLLPTALDGVFVIEPDIFRDPRGFFVETYNQLKYCGHGLSDHFVQDNHSRSGYGTIRGLHAQRLRPQGKLVRATRGTIFDVVVDIRRNSPTFRHWISVEISDDNLRQIYVPAGFAHGLCVLSAFADVEYKCTSFYDPSDELRIAWNDPEIGIRWPVAQPLLSLRDRDEAKPLDKLMEFLPE
jgi:dTDP-4-dehydrorhamnose 3,5-epimerase